MSKVNVISGFLGAGKTTFIKELLEKVFKGQKVVLIENEFGEIGIDGSFLNEAGIEITEMNSGCICCSLVGDFSKALQKVSKEYNPDRIIIEPSGVGKLSDVKKAVESVPGIEYESGITVVDAKKAKKYLKNFGEFFNNQVEYADTVVLSRTGDIEEEKLHETLHIIRDLNNGAAIITTPWESLDSNALNKALNEKHINEKIIHELEEECHHEHHHEHEDHEHHHEHGHDEHCCCHDHEHEHHHEDHEHHHEHEHEHDEHCCCHEHEHHHHADEVFNTIGGETVHKFGEDELNKLLEKFASSEEYGIILRSKGIISLEDGSWREFDLVPDEIEIRQCAPDYIGRIVVIGTELKEDEIKKAIFI